MGRVIIAQPCTASPPHRSAPSMTSPASEPIIVKPMLGRRCDEYLLKPRVSSGSLRWSQHIASRQPRDPRGIPLACRLALVSGPTRAMAGPGEQAVGNQPINAWYGCATSGLSRNDRNRRPNVGKLRTSGACLRSPRLGRHIVSPDR